MVLMRSVERVTSVKLSREDVEAAIASLAGLPNGLVKINMEKLEDGYSFAVVEERISEFALGMGNTTDEEHERWALMHKDTIIAQLDQQNRDKKDYSLTAFRAAHLIRALEKLAAFHRET